MNSDEARPAPRPHARRPVRAPVGPRPGRPDRRARPRRRRPVRRPQRTGRRPAPAPLRAGRCAPSRRRRSARSPGAVTRPAGPPPPLRPADRAPASAVRPRPSLVRRVGALGRRSATASTWPGARPLRRSPGRPRPARTRSAGWRSGAPATQGEYLAWGRPGRLRPDRPQRGIDPPVVLREMPSTPTIRHRGAFPRCGPHFPADRRFPAAERAAPRVPARTYGDRVFTTRPELAGTFGMVASTHWLASAAGHGDPRGRRQRVRRRRRRRVHPPGRRAAPQRSRWRGPDPLRPGRAAGRGRRRGRVRRPVRSGGRPRRRDDRGLRAARSRPRPRHRPPRRDRPGRRRRLADAAARPRHPAAGRRPPLRHRVRRDRSPSPSPGDRDRRLGLRALPHPLAHFGRHLALPRRCPSGRRQTFPQFGSRLDLPPTARRSARTLPGGADRCGTVRLVLRIRRRGDRQIRPVSGDGRLRSSAPRISDRARPGRLDADVRATGHAGPAGVDAREGRAVVAGTGSAPGDRDAGRRRAAGPRPVRLRTSDADTAEVVHASVEAIEAGDGRPRGLVRGRRRTCRWTISSRPPTPPSGGRSSGTRPAPPCGRVHRVGARLGSRPSSPRDGGPRRPARGAGHR